MKVVEARQCVVSVRSESDLSRSGCCTLLLHYQVGSSVVYLTRGPAGRVGQAHSPGVAPRVAGDLHGYVCQLLLSRNGRP